jgi:hypothetical protein
MPYLKLFIIITFALLGSLNSTFAAEHVDRVSLPNGCSFGESGCATRFLQKASIIVNKHRFNISKNSSLLSLEAGFTLLKGKLAVKAGGESMILNTEYAEIHVPESSEVIIKKEKDRVLVVSFSGEVKVKNRFGRFFELPEGFEISVGAVNTNGDQSVSSLSPVKAADLLTDCAAIYSKLDEFSGSLKSLKETEAARVALAATVYRARIDRGIASLAEKKKKEDEIRKLQSLKNKAMRDQFRAKLNEEFSE